MSISFLFSFAFRFSSFHRCLSGLLRQPFCPLALLSLGMVLISASCTMSTCTTCLYNLISASCTTLFHNSSGTLSIRSNPLNLFVTSHCIIVRDLIYVIPECSSGFHYFLQFKPEFGNKEFMVLATVSSWSCFC